MQSVPLKVSGKVDIITPITKWVKKNFGKKIDPALTTSLEKIQKQRNIVCETKTFNGLNSISDLKCYLSYLQQIEKVFPVTGKHCIEVPWAWTDSFGGKKVTVYDIIYEEASVMYNIAALFTVAAAQQFNVNDLTIERITACIDHLRNAALYFRELRNQYSSRLENLKTSGDLNSQVLQVLESLCLAQGQYAFFLKAQAKEMPKLYVVLLKRAADLYKTIMDLAKKTKGYFPPGLEKHFELQYNLLSLQTLHYYGMQLMENSETNGGNLYKLGGRIDDLRVETEKLFNSFHSEYSDQLQTRDVLNLVREDSRKFYMVYRTYGGSVPVEVEMPDGAMKMNYAEDLGITEVPISLPIPENANVLKALSRYQQAYRQKVDEMEVLCRKKNDELKKMMCEYLLPEILTAEGFASGLPETIQKHLQAVQASGSLRGLQDKVNQLEASYLNQKDKLDALKSQVEKGSEYSEIVTWIEKSLKTFNDKITELKKAVASMSNKSIIFNESGAKLAMSLPSCPNYPTSQASVQVKNCSDKASNLLSQRDELRHALLLDRSGETLVRSRVQADGNLLNVETILYSAMTGVENICQQIKSNCDQQSLVVKSLKTEYTKWNKSRHVTSEMKKREDALRDVNANLNLFDDNMQLVEGLEEVRNAIDSSLQEVLDKLGINCV